MSADEDGPAARAAPSLGLRAATTLNMLSMIGAGPFLTIPLILQSMHGPQALLGWIVGALVALADGLVWAELGAALPRSGGGYRYLLEAYGEHGPGRLLSFLFLWQTVIAFPLMMASGAVGFAHYLQYLVPSLGAWQMKGLAALVCLVSAALVYRRIDRVGRWGTVFGALVLVAIGWVILEGVLHGDPRALYVPAGAWELSGSFWAGLGGATLYSVYDYLGYNNICSYAGEVQRPAATIPRSIVLSVLLVAALYLAMNVSIISVMPWQDAAASQYVVSEFIARLRPGAAATVMTWLILVTIFAALFAAMCATARIPYAAAADGHFFPAFARLHPTGRFPSFSVAFVGVASAVACLLELDALITALMAIYVVIGALPIIGAVTALRRRRDVARPFSMWWYPLPCLAAAAGWLAILVTSGIWYIAAGFGLLAVGVASYLWRARRALPAFLIASAFWAAGAAAQSTAHHDVFGRYQQVIWQERDGLPQNTVVAIATTRDGYLWLGTYEGVARFDGVRFTLFNPGNTTGIGNSFVTSLVERRDGDLWLGTYGGGVSRLAGGRFTQYAMRDGLSSDFVWCLFEDHAGTLWIGTDGGGVNALIDGRFTPYTIANGLPSNLVRAIAADGNGGVLVGTSRGIARIADGRVSPYAGRADVAHADVSTLARAADGSLWVAPMSGGLYRVDSRDVTEFGPADGLAHDRVESLFADDEGRMLVGTSLNGLFRYSGARFERYAPADGLPGARVPVIGRDVKNGLWIGTDGGLVRFKQPRVTVYTQRDGLAGDFVGGIFQDGEGSVWAETGHGLTRFVNGAFKAFTTNDGIPGGRIKLASGADRFPLVYSEGGLARWTHDRFVLARDVGGLPWDRVNTVVEDRTGTLWLGTHGGGVIRVRDGHATSLTTKEGLADDSVEALFEDRQGNLWVGTLSNGVTRISNGRMTSWSTRDGLAANQVKAFYQDARGTLWIGTHGGGLSRFKDGRFATVSTRQGLYNDQIFQILEDDDANLWMNCNTGIWRTSLKQLNEVADGRRTAVESFAYGTADGMLSSEGVGANLAGWKMRDGSLWFPTTKGIVAIDPRRRDTDPPRVLIEGATIDREPIVTGGPVEVTPGQESLDIQYTGLNWSRPQAIRFRYRLVGLDRDWVDAGSRRTAYYSHLPPGSYTFNVTADNGDGVWDPAGKTLAIVVLPRVYQTWWFRAAVASSLVAFVWLSWRYRIGQMRRAKEAQEAFSRQLIESQEGERQRIAAELHDSLGQNLLVAKNRALLGALSQQDEAARRQFNEIGATVAQTLEEVRAISHNLRPHHLDQLGLTTTIRATIEQIAGSSGIAIRSDLDDIDGVFPPADEITIYRIVQESLNNVVKHSGAREAQVAVRCHEHHVEMTIQDNGQGFAANAPTGRTGDPGGFGLKGLAERVHMLGGRHTIESAPGRGTTVTVRLARRSLGEGGLDRREREPRRGE